MFVLSEEHVLEEVFEKMLSDTSPQVVKECCRLHEKCDVRIGKKAFKKAISRQIEEKIIALF